MKLIKQGFFLVAIFSLLVASTVNPQSANAAICTSTQSLTEGPYYSTNTPIKSNITSAQLGTKTVFTINVVDEDCNAVKGAKVDIWHANAAGKYSAVEGNNQNFLRGSQITNTAGKVTFTTIYPGWYPGRTMHIHFKVWRNGAQVLTSQFFVSDSNNAAIYASGEYAKRGNQDTPLARDRIYGELSDPKSLTLSLKKVGKTINLNGKIVI